MEIKYSNNKKNFKTEDTSKLFGMYEKVPINNPVTLMQPVKGVWEDTKLSKLYFSPKNINIIQNGLRAGIYNISNKQYTIGLQDENELFIIMKSIFLQHSKNNMDNITNQISALNKMVVDYCITQIYGEIQGYIKYIDNLDSSRNPIAHPMLATEKNKDPLVFKKWF